MVRLVPQGAGECTGGSVKFTLCAVFPVHGKEHIVELVNGAGGVDVQGSIQSPRVTGPDLVMEGVSRICTKPGR